MEAKAQKKPKKADNMKEKTSTSIYKKDSKIIQKRKVDEDHNNAAETIELILDEHERLQHANEQMEREIEELEKEISFYEDQVNQLKEKLEESE